MNALPSRGMRSDAPTPAVGTPAGAGSRTWALREVGPATSNTSQTMPYWLNAKRTDAGRRLPEPYLVYFLLVELLGFPHTGMGEKVAWTVPLEYGGQTFTVEYRKIDRKSTRLNSSH